MGINVGKVGEKPVEIAGKENVIQKQPTQQEESIFAKNEGSKIADAVEITSGILFGIAAVVFLPKLLKSRKNPLVNALESTIKKAQKSGSSISLSKLQSTKAGKTVAQTVNREEKAFYESILKEFDDMHPEKISCYPEACTYYNKKHINGALSEISLADKLVYDSNGITKHFVQEERSFEYILGKKKLNCTPKGQFNGDETLIKEYQAFLNGRNPNTTNFKMFMEQKDVDYIRKNGIWNIESKAQQISKEKGEIIKAQEKIHRSRMQSDLEKLWRPYSTRQYYRIVGKEELIKMLRGEKIVSPRYAQYGKMQTDITSNPYYHEIFFGEQKFRISFKGVNYDGSGNASFARRVSEWAPETQHYHLNGPYTRNDVKLDEIMYWNGGDWAPLEIVS